MSEPGALPSLISSLRALGYAEFALLRTDSLADIAMTRQLDQARHTVAEATRHTVAEATRHTVAEATMEPAAAESVPVGVTRPGRARMGDLVVVADLESDAPAVEIEEELPEEQEEPATAGSPRDGRRSRTLLADIKFLDE